MYNNSDADISYVVMNTDSQALISSPVPNKLLLGPDVTEGLGAGANPSTAEEAALSSKDEIYKILNDGAKMIFITAGMLFVHSLRSCATIPYSRTSMSV